VNFIMTTASRASRSTSTAASTITSNTTRLPTSSTRVPLQTRPVSSAGQRRGRWRHQEHQPVDGGNFIDNKGISRSSSTTSRKTPCCRRAVISAHARSVGEDLYLRRFLDLLSRPLYRGPRAADPGSDNTVADSLGNPRAFNAATDQFNFGPYNYTAARRSNTRSPRLAIWTSPRKCARTGN